MYVKLNQIVLGSYIATYLYCLLVLNAVNDGDKYTFIPSFSILMAIIAAIVNIILLIIFIHQIAVSIQADKVLADISVFLAKQVQTLFPETMGEEKEENKAVDIASVMADFPESTVLKSPTSGYLQYIDSDGLMEVITQHNALFKLDHRPGSYLVKGMELGTIYSTIPFKQDTIDTIVDQFVFGKTKTSEQDVEFSIHQIVEVAVRALSPGVNDPYTAIAAIDNLTATLSHLAQVKFPSQYRYDEDQNLRVVANVLDFQGILNAAFNQIRQFSAGSPAVIIRLMEALLIIQKFTTKASYQKAVLKHAKMVLRLGKQTIKEENDLEDLKKRFKKISKT